MGGISQLWRELEELDKRIDTSIRINSQHTQHYITLSLIAIESMKEKRYDEKSAFASQLEGIALYYEQKGNQEMQEYCIERADFFTREILNRDCR